MANQVQYLGLARFTSLLAAASWYLQWGTGTGAARTATTLTTTGTTEARTLATTSQVTVTQTNDTLQLVGTIVAIGTPTIEQVGAWDAAGTGGPPTGGNMDLYGDFTGIGLAAGDSIAFTIKLTFS